MRGSKLMCLCAGRRLVGFSAGIKIDLVLNVGIELTWFLCAGRKQFVFSVEID